MPLRRADRAARSRRFARGVDADVGLRRRTISLAGDARTDSPAHRLLRRRFCLCAGPPAQYLAEPVVPHGRDAKSRPGICRRADHPEHRLLLHRRSARHHHRRAARHRSGHDGSHAAADLVHPAAGVGLDPARRHLLRRPVRRLDHRHPGQHPGRGVLGRDHHRRPPDGASGTRRTGARHCRARFILRRLRLDAADRARGPAARGHRLAVRSGGIFLADGVRLGCSRRSRARIARQSDRDGRARLLLGLVGTDVNTGARRFNFGMMGLADGIEFAAISMAIYGIAEVVYNLERKQEASVVSGALGRVWPSLADLRYCAGSILRGTGLGAILGVLPGGGALLASFAAYTLEKKVARPPRQFGYGDIRGVAAPEAANNAGAQTSFIPMPTLGIPGNPTMAMMIGALMIHGIAPGPRVMTDRPGLFWGLIASMWLGNLMLVVLNLPLVGIWVKLLRVPYRLLYPVIIVFCCIGAYTINNKAFDVFVMSFFAIFGYVALKLECEPAPLILGFVLGPMMEENLRRALLISRGDPMVFLQEPMSLAFLVLAAGLLVVMAVPAIRIRREEALKE